MEDKTEFPQEVLIYFSSNNQKMELPPKCFPTANSAVDLFIFSPGVDCQQWKKNTRDIWDQMEVYQGSCLVGQDKIESL